MNKTATKILISVVSILVVLVLIRLIVPINTADSDGKIYLIILDSHEAIVFEGELSYLENDTFYDILDRHFELTCANQSYQADPTCGFSFQNFTHQGKVILGIKGDTFEVMTDWHQSFLAFEYELNDAFVLATQGPSNMPFNDQERFRISVRNPWG